MSNNSKTITRASIIREQLSYLSLDGHYDDITDTALLCSELLTQSHQIDSLCILTKTFFEYATGTAHQAFQPEKAEGLKKDLGLN